ncbi:MAG: hypothetical protein NTV56_00080 [Alphaproteobacteria bacterium]|nr:hypothetical protein [Alphaproteobacteria bacterium]
MHGSKPKKYRKPAANPHKVDAAKARRTGVLVLGMHRSGTSALSGMLVGLGCAAPRTLMGASSTNVRGHWESASIVALNDEILSSAGSVWSDWRPFNNEWVQSAPGLQYVESARDVFQVEFKSYPLFVLKDPRICRLSKIWIPIIEADDVEIKVVLPIRHPIEVARSINARDNIPIMQGLLTWLRHVLDAERVSRVFPRSFVFYPDFLDNWRDASRKVARDLGIIWPRNSQLAYAEIERFLSAELYHERRNNRDRSDHLAELTDQVYQLMRELGSGDTGTRAEARKTLDRIGREFDAAASVFGPLLAFSEMVSGQNSYLRLRLPGAESPLVISSALEGSSYAAVAEYGHESVRKEVPTQKEFAHVADLEAKQQQLEVLEAQIVEMRGSHDELVRAMVEKAGQLRAEVADLDHALTEAIAQTQAEREGRQRAQHVLNQERSLAEDLATKLGSLQQENSDVQEKLSDVTSRFCATQYELEEEHSRAQNFAIQLRDLQQEYSAVQDNLAATTSELTAVQAIAEGQRAEIELVKSTLDVERQKIIELSQIIDESHTWKIELSNLLEHEQQERFSAIDRLSSAQKELTKLREELAGRTAELDSANATLMAEQANFVMQLRDLQQEYSAVQDNLAATTSELTAVQAIAEGQRAEIELLKSTLDVERQKIIELTQIIDESHTRKIELSNLLDHEQKERFSTLDQLLSAQKTLKELREELAERTDELESANATLMAERANAEGVARELQETHSARDGLHKSLFASNAERQAAQDKLVAAQQDLATLCKDLNVTKADFDSASAALEMERTNVFVLTGQMGETQAALDELRERLTEQRAQIESISLKLANANAARTEIETRYVWEQEQRIAAQELLANAAQHLATHRERIIALAAKVKGGDLPDLPPA